MEKRIKILKESDQKTVGRRQRLIEDKYKDIEERKRYLQVPQTTRNSADQRTILTGPD